MHGVKFLHLLIGTTHLLNNNKLFDESLQSARFHDKSGSLYHISMLAVWWNAKYVCAFCYTPTKVRAADFVLLLLLKIALAETAVGWCGALFCVYSSSVNYIRKCSAIVVPSIVRTKPPFHLKRSSRTVTIDDAFFFNCVRSRWLAGGTAVTQFPPRETNGSLNATAQLFVFLYSSFWWNICHEWRP